MASCVMAFLPTGRSRKDKATKNRGATKNQGADKGSAKYIGKRTCKGKGKDLPAPNQEWTDTIFTGVFARRVREYGWIQLDYFYQLPADLKQAIINVLEEKQQRLHDASKNDTLFNSFVVFMHKNKRSDKKSWPRPGDRLSFKLYTADVGVGAHEISITHRASNR